MTEIIKEAAKLGLLLEIAARGIDLVERQEARRYKQSDLNSAYSDWREKQNIRDRIGRDTSEWKKMMKATDREYGDLEDAKREERNAEKRLRTYVYKYKAVVDADKNEERGLPAFDDNRLANADLLAEHLP